jgi:hypothetical protein
MNGDFSRLTFDPAKHYSAVLIQQGRVNLDADSLEQAAIVLHQLRTTTADLIGPHGGPAGDGFLVTPTPDATGQVTDLTLGGGRYYVDGILCENDRDDVTYRRQPQALPDEDVALPAPPFLVYLRVFERLVSALEDPSIREVALGDNGPDTAARAQVVWQLVVGNEIPGTGITITSSTVADDVHNAWQTQLPKTASLKARGRQPTPDDDDPCVIRPEARYRGAENQLYRVQVHVGGSADDATFMWSRDNGSVCFPIREMHDAAVTLGTLGRDEVLGLEVGDWVEVVDDHYTERGRTEPLQRIKSVDPIDLLVEFEEIPASATGRDPALHPFLRRWDHRDPVPGTDDPALAPDHGLRVVEGDVRWLDLEDGVQIQFELGGAYSPGDYWLVPARTATGNVLWPTVDNKPVARPPDGVGYHVAPLAMVTGSDATVDLRCQFERMACPPTP